MNAPKMPRSQEEIKKMKESFGAEIAQLEASIKYWRGLINFVQEVCKHPNKFEYTCMGDLGWKCPDCGWAT